MKENLMRSDNDVKKDKKLRITTAIYGNVILILIF